MFLIFFTALITGNVLLSKFLGTKLLFENSKEKNFISLSILIIIIVLISTITTFLLNKYVLIPTNTIYLETISFIILVFIIVGISKLIIRKYFNNLYESFDLSLITINSLVFGIILLNIKSDYSLIEVLINSLGCCLGYLLVLFIIEGNKEKIRNNDIIPSFKGIPIVLIMIGIIALIFSRFMI